MADYKALAARAVAYCPRDLAEALCAELGMTMPEGYFDTADAWPGRTFRSWPYRDVPPASCACCGKAIPRPHCSECHDRANAEPARVTEQAPIELDAEWNAIVRANPGRTDLRRRIIGGVMCIKYRGDPPVVPSTNPKPYTEPASEKIDRMLGYPQWTHLPLWATKMLVGIRDGTALYDEGVSEMPKERPQVEPMAEGKDEELCAAVRAYLSTWYGRPPAEASGQDPSVVSFERLIEILHRKYKP